MTFLATHHYHCNKDGWWDPLDMQPKADWVECVVPEPENDKDLMERTCEKSERLEHFWESWESGYTVSPLKYTALRLVVSEACYPPCVTSGHLEGLVKFSLVGNTRLLSRAMRARRPGFYYRLCHSLAVWPDTSYFTSVWVTFPTCLIGIMIFICLFFHRALRSLDGEYKVLSVL